MAKVVLGLALLLLATGTGPVLDTRGPVVTVVGNEVCLSGTGDSRQTVSVTLFWNTGAYPVEVTRATLVRSSNMRLLAAWLVPLDGTPRVGVWTSYVRPAGPKWREASPVVGTTVRPGEKMEFGVGVASKGRAHAETVALFYRDSAGREYVTHIGPRIVVVPSCLDDHGTGKPFSR